MGYKIFKFLRTMERHSWLSCFAVCFFVNEVLQDSPLGDGFIISIIISIIATIIISIAIDYGEHALVNMTKRKIDEHFGTNKNLIKFNNDEIEAKANDGVTAYIPYSFINKYVSKKECQANNLSFSDLFKNKSKSKLDLLTDKLSNNSL